MQVKQHQGWWRKWPLIFLLVNYILVVISLRTFPLSHLLDGHDSSMFMYFGRAMNHGMVPYVDMFDHKGIVLFLIQQFGNLIGFGSFRSGVWVTEALFYAVFLILMSRSVYLITKQLLSATLPFLFFTPLTMAIFQGGNLSEEFVLPFIAGALLAFITIEQQQHATWWPLVMIGVLGALTFFTRPNMIALWVVGCLYLLAKGLITRQLKVLEKQILGIFLGGALVCLIVIAYAWLTHSGAAMIYETFTLNVEYSAQSNNQIRIAAVKFFYQLMRNYGVLFIAVIYVSLIEVKREWWVVNGLVISYALLNFVTVVLSGRPYLHYFTTALPCVYLISGIGLAQLSHLIVKQNWRTLTAALVVISAFASLVNLWPNQTLYATTKTLIDTQYRVPNQRKNSGVAAISTYIREHSKPTDKIYVHWMNANIYLKSERFANSEYFVLPSLDYTQHPEVVKNFETDFKRTPPKFVVVQASFMHAAQTGLFGFVKAQTQQHYKLIQTYSAGTLMLYQRK